MKKELLQDEILISHIRGATAPFLCIVTKGVRIPERFGAKAL